MFKKFSKNSLSSSEREVQHLTPLLSCSQVGAVGENEDWLMVHQVFNEPEARSLEVPGLNPYTSYR